MPDLTFIPSDELIAELQRRHETVLVIRQDSKNGQNFREYDYHGGIPTCIGLAVLFLKYALLEGDEADDGSTEV